jgi:hypothetical protein
MAVNVRYHQVGKVRNIGTGGCVIKLCAKIKIGLTVADTFFMGLVSFRLVGSENIVNLTK